jgi:hypothetical protein
MATTTRADRTLTLPRVVAALGGILVLALVLPFLAVGTFHQRRLDRADRELRRIAAAVAANGAAWPPGTQVLAGAGPRPTVTDDGWNTAPAVPLARVIGDSRPDPWGNAYLVALSNRPAPIVLSAGPDGILQTPFTAAAAVGDDRSASGR